MKTAEEWARTLQHSANFHRAEVSLEDNIKAIQLDAWKQGIQDAIDSLEIDPTSSTPNSDATIFINKRLHEGLKL